MLQPAVNAIARVLNLMNSNQDTGFHFSSSSSSSNSDFYGSSSSSSSSDSKHGGWELYGGFILYLALMVYVFAGFDLICDVYFVPALNVFCEVLHLSEDFAGAILMGIGSNLPDVFSATVGVCILHTDVGTGSIVGSSLFNLLFIIGVCLLVMKNIKLQLKYLVREAGFYFLSIVLFIVCLYDHKVTIYESISMLLLYAIYVIVCAFTPQIMKALYKARGKGGNGGYTRIDSDTGLINATASMYLINDDTENTSDKQPLIDFTSSPTLTTASTDTPTTPPTTSPSTAEKPNTFARLAAFSKELEKDNDDNDDDDNDDDNDDNNNNNSSNTNEDYNEGDNNSSNSNDDGKTRIKKSHIRAYHKIMKAMKKTKGAAVESGLDVGLPYGEVQMHGFLYKKSRWYTKINISSQIWQKRWFVLSDTFWYCRNPLSPEKNRREIPLWKVWKVEASPDDACNILLYTKKQTYILRAVSADVAAKWTEALRERIEAVRDALPQYYSDSGLVDVDEDGDDDYVSTLEYPFGESTGHIVFWALTYPLALLFALTIPDTRKDKCKKMFVLSFIMVSIWIGGMSYAMVWAADRFAHVFHIPDDLMGLTITAFGSSLPSLFGSVVAAKQGSPDMAIANAFGSSLTALFSIGLPCFIYSVIHKGGPYFCESGAILITNFILIGSLIFFLIFAGISKLKLNYIHGVIFTVAYFVFMAFIVIIEQPWKPQD